MNEVNPSHAVNSNSEPNWKELYKAGAISALISLLLFPAQIAIFFTNPYPVNVTEWFALLASKPLVGLVELDLLLLVDEVLVILIFLALYAALKELNRSIMLSGTVLGVISAVLFVASNPAFSMLSLSGLYANAVTEVQRSSLLAAGEAVMSIWIGSGWETAYFIGSIAPIAISVVMLRSPLFKKATAYFGIASNVVALGKYVPTIGIYISIFSVVLLWVWYLLIALDLFKLGRLGKANAA